jgi:phage-related protein
LEQVRQLLFFQNHFNEFFNSLPEKVKEKMDYILYVLTVVERIPKKFFKHIEGTDGLYEIRIEFESNIYRVFCCFDEEKVIVLFNGFQKKSQKTPKQELDKANNLKLEYFKSKTI